MRNIIKIEINKKEKKAIIYDKNANVKNKNISLGYFGRAEKVSAALKKSIITFVLSWRFEKSFRTLEHYHNLKSAVREMGND